MEYEIPTSVHRALGEWTRTNSPVTHWYNKMSPHRVATSYTKDSGYFDQDTEDPGKLVLFIKIWNRCVDQVSETTEWLQKV